MKLFISIFSFILLISCGTKAQPPEFRNHIGIQFILIQPGSVVVGKFQPSVGKVDFDGKPLPEKMIKASEEMAKNDIMQGFEVKIEKPFYIGKYEITQGQWQKVLGANPSIFKNDSSANQPVENISWTDAQQFLKKLNSLDKKHHYRLPTEFEWEYAARAGATDDIPWKEINAAAVLGGTMPAKVGTKKPNAWGIYDMLGNVWEWTADFYNEKIFADPSPMRSGKEHVLKGASFTGDVKNATYMTHAGGPGNGYDIGLRIVMETK
ncbi:formylglycine-generating enzyme family protein [Pollutibacter soli]|uniref:formylglycine-generating enzyme family protein n=1 Tax=Pollutibacter soli TaxID=3034157 RepID=UPI0030135F25